MKMNTKKLVKVALIALIACLSISCRVTYVKVHTINIDRDSDNLIERTKTTLQDSTLTFDRKLYTQPWQR